MAEYQKFRTVGYRFARLLVDESPVAAATENEVRLEISVTAETPRVAERDYKSRKVIEVAVKVIVDVTDQHTIPETQSREVVHALCLAGFVGLEEKNDGVLEVFEAETDAVIRSLYWLTRQRIQSLLTATSLRHLTLPWEPSKTAQSRTADAMSAAAVGRKKPVRTPRKAK